MFINPISSINKSQSQQTSFGSATKTAIQRKIQRNQLKILLTQDIWASNLKIKMPETPLEKEVLLEVLKNRLKLDRFTQLSNEKFKTKGDLIIYNELSEKDPENKELEPLRKILEEKGPLARYFNNINQELKAERKNNQDAMIYFNNISDLEETYLKRRLINPNKMEHFYAQVKKYNINTDGKYSTQELIDIIESGKLPETVKKAEATPKILPKKQLLTKMEIEYEARLKENFNMYKRPLNHDKEIATVKENLERKYIDSIIKYPEIGTNLTKIYKRINDKFLFKLKQILNIQIFSISTGWEKMRQIEAAISGVNVEIKTLKSQLEADKNNEKIKEAIELKEKTVEDLKYNWGKWLEFSVEHEKINRQRMADAGKEAEYSYITEENKLIKKHSELYKIFLENNKTMPESYWIN